MKPTRIMKFFILILETVNRCTLTQHTVHTKHHKNIKNIDALLKKYLLANLVAWRDRWATSGDLRGTVN